MTTKKATTRKPAAKPVQRGNMTPAEIQPLAIAARRAFDYQRDLGNVDDAVKFDVWRRQQCLAAVKKPGLTACNHDDYRPLMAHFQILAGNDERAFTNLMTSGKATPEKGDTHEERRVLAFQIAQALEAHTDLATKTIDQLIAEGAAAWAEASPGVPFPGPHPQWLATVKSRQAAITASGKGPLGAGYLVYVVRQKTRRPDLNLGTDWQAGLADRCTVSQLRQIRSTIINRIAAREGVGSSASRNKSQRSPKARAARSKPQEPRW